MSYYAEAHHWAHTFTVTVWTNMPGVESELRGLGELIERDCDNGHFCYTYHMDNFEAAVEAVQIVNDCQTVETMLAGVEVFAR